MVAVDGIYQSIPRILKTRSADDVVEQRAKRLLLLLSLLLFLPVLVFAFLLVAVFIPAIHLRFFLRPPRGHLRPESGHSGCSVRCRAHRKVKRSSLVVYGRRQRQRRG